MSDLLLVNLLKYFQAKQTQNNLRYLLQYTVYYIRKRSLFHQKPLTGWSVVMYPKNIIQRRV